MRTTVVSILTVLLLVPAVPAAASPSGERVTDAVRVGGGLRFTPDAPGQDRDLVDTATAVSGLGPRRFLGTVELLPRRRGIDVVNELPFDTYLYGLAEVPRSWPEAVLDAQVIAARTYAWHAIERSAYRDYDICATTACQVFRGAEVLFAPGGDRWRDAVDRTSGQVLLHDGGPILARYFSTSGGRTYPNEFVFPSSGPRPYLTGIEDPYDALSPLHRWDVRFSRDEFDAMLAQGRRLRTVVPVRRVERLGAVDDPRAEFRLTGRNGRSVTIRAIELRDFLSARARELDPERFPPLRRDGAARMPSTIPTTRYAITLGDDWVDIEGLGWGHGVGMGQWGAHARALEGHSADEILAAYYGGIRPRTDRRVPRVIRAGMGPVRLDAPGAGMTVTLRVPGDVTDRSGRRLDRGLGTWSIDRVRTATGAPSGEVLVLTPPPGHGETLTVEPSTSGPILPAGPGRPRVGVDRTDLWDGVLVRTAVNKPVLLRLEARRIGDGTVTWSRELGLAERGPHWVRWFPEDAPGLEPSGHRFVLVGTDVTGAVAGEWGRWLSEP